TDVVVRALYIFHGLRPRDLVRVLRPPKPVDRGDERRRLLLRRRAAHRPREDEERKRNGEARRHGGIQGRCDAEKAPHARYHRRANPIILRVPPCPRASLLHSLLSPAHAEPPAEVTRAQLCSTSRGASSLFGGRSS